jgi:uncharacterized protein (DUF58 family)
MGSNELTFSSNSTLILKRLFLFIGALWNGLIPSPRLAFYVAAGAILWLTSAVLPLFATLALIYNFALIVLAVIDLVFSPSPKQIEVWRTYDAKMNLGVPNTVTLHAKNRSNRRILLTLRDEVPESFSISSEEPIRYRDETALPVLPRAIFEVEANDESSGFYRLSPNRRGDFRFGLLSGRYPTALGLWFRQFKTQNTSSEARVYPDTTAVRRYEIALREGKMRDIGLHLLKLRGQGTEFESLRDYNGDDEFKSINWKASARRGKLISTNYEIERDQTMMICLDCGRMMSSMAISKEENKEVEADHDTSSFHTPHSSLLTSTTPLSKLDCAINATVLLAHVAASMGDAVGLMLFSDGVLNYLPPRKGRVQTGLIIEALYKAQPSLVEPDYQVAYETLLARKVRRSLVVTFTDIVDNEASRELLNSSAMLRKHHNALCVTINNRDVIDLAAQFPNNSNELYEKAMAQRMLSQRQTALENLRSFGVGILDVEANELSVATVNRYLDLKSRGML